MGASEYGTEATRERVIRFLIMASRAFQRAPPPPPSCPGRTEGEDRSGSTRRGAVLEGMRQVSIHLLLHPRAFCCSLHPRSQQRPSGKGKRGPGKGPAPWLEDGQGTPGSSIQVPPQLFPAPEGEAPLPPHSIKKSPTHSEWPWPIEGFPTRVPRVTGEIWRAREGAPGGG